MPYLVCNGLFTMRKCWAFVKFCYFLDITNPTLNMCNRSLLSECRKFPKNQSRHLLKNAHNWKSQNEKIEMMAIFTKVERCIEVFVFKCMASCFSIFWVFEGIINILIVCLLSTLGEIPLVKEVIWRILSIAKYSKITPQYLECCFLWFVIAFDIFYWFA